MIDAGDGGSAVPTDEALVASTKTAQEGDLRAFTELVRRHQTRVMANCRYLSGSDADAEDLAQEVMVKAYFGLPRFEARARFTTWLYRIKVNHCLNFNEARARRRHLEADVPLIAPEAGRVAPVGVKRLVAQEVGEGVRTVLDGMPESLRIPLILRDADGWSYQEIADTLVIGLSAVKMRISRARRLFRDRYELAAASQDSSKEPDGTELASPRS